MSWSQGEEKDCWTDAKVIAKAREKNLEIRKYKKGNETVMKAKRNLDFHVRAEDKQCMCLALTTFQAPPKATTEHVGLSDQTATE